MLKKKKISELPLADTLIGLSTIGVDSGNNSVQVELEFLSDAAVEAVSSAAAARAAASLANSAAIDADDKAKLAQTKANLADQSAINATDAAQVASVATKEAQAAISATEAATTTALEIAGNPTKIGEDNYAYIYDLQSKTYVKTDILVKGETGPKGDKGDPGPQGLKGDPGAKGEQGESDFEVDEVRMSYSTLGNIFGEKYLPCDGSTFQDTHVSNLPPQIEIPWQSYGDLITDIKFLGHCFALVTLSGKVIVSDGPLVYTGYNEVFPNVMSEQGVIHVPLTCITHGDKGYFIGSTKGRFITSATTEHVLNPNGYRLSWIDEIGEFTGAYYNNGIYYMTLGNSESSIVCTTDPADKTKYVTIFANYEGQSNSQEVNKIEFLTTPDGLTYMVALFKESGCWATEDNGVTWPFGSVEHYQAIAVSENVMYIIDDTGAIYSTSDFVNYEQLGKAPEPSVAAIDIAKVQDVWYITKDREIWMSYDLKKWIKIFTATVGQNLKMAFNPGIISGLRRQFAVGYNYGEPAEETTNHILSTYYHLITPNIPNGYIKVLK